MKLGKLIGKSLLLTGVLALPILVVRGCNSFFNNQHVKSAGRETISYSTGIVGHNEFTKYIDGSVDLKVYPGIMGHRLASSVLYQDLNGDGKVDRIRRNGPEWKHHKLEEVLVRSTDYESNKDAFDGADRLLSEEREIYNSAVTIK